MVIVGALMRIDKQRAEPHCSNCRSFRNDAAYLESEFPGLTSLSSGFGSARSDDGICTQHGRYLGAQASCASFAAADDEVRVDGEHP
jgi:hypothetical protein